MKESIQEMRDEIFHNYGVDVKEMNSEKIRQLSMDLDELGDALSDQEAIANTMKDDMLRAIKGVAQRYKKHFDTIYLFGSDVDQMDDTDIDFEE